MRPTKSPLDQAFEALRPVLWVTAIFSTLINFLMFVGPLYMMQVYDRVLASRNIGTLLALTLISAFLLATFAALDIFRSRVLVRAGVKFDETLKKALFQTTLKTALSQRNPGSSSRLRDMDTVREFCTGAGMLTLFDAPFVPIFVIVCFLIHPWIGMVAIVGGGILFALALVNERMTRQALTEAGKVSSEAGYVAAASTRNIEAVHSLGMHGAMYRRWHRLHDAVLGWQAHASDRAGLVLALTKFTRQFLQIAILGVGAWLAIDRQISPGVMIAASIMMGRAVAPVEQAVSQWKAMMGAKAAWDRLRQLFAETALDEEPTPLPAPNGHLSAQDITVTMPNRKEPIVKGVTIEAQRGQVLAVIGPSGSGKSTLARALVGVLPLEKGTVRIDGSELKHWDAERLGKHIGYLPQSVELFAGTVGDNISRFSEESEEKLFAAAEIAGVHKFVQSLPKGYDTEIGDGGSNLSGGQRQRVALARALYGDPGLVVLDEPNSNLDNEGERELVMALMRAKAKGTTVIVITHRPNLLTVADKVVVLADGVVRMAGPPQEVLKALATPRVVSETPNPQPAQPITAEAAAGGERKPATGEQREGGAAVAGMREGQGYRVLM